MWPLTERCCLLNDRPHPRLNGGIWPKPVRQPTPINADKVPPVTEIDLHRPELGRQASRVPRGVEELG